MNGGAAVSAAKPRAEYQERLATRRGTLGRTEAIHGRWGLVRLAVLAVGGWAAWSWITDDLAAGWLALPWVAFVAVGQLMARNERRQQRLARAIRLYERGLERLADRWAGHGPTGEEHLDHDHPYARDLDLFGEGSLFQLLCAARTTMGRSRLANWLEAPAGVEVVRARQQAVQELAAELDFRERLAVRGADVAGRIHPDLIAGWGEREPTLSLSALGRALVRLGAAAGLAAVGAIFAHLAAQVGLLALSGETLAGIRIGVAGVLLVLAAVVWRTRGPSREIFGGVETAARELELLAELLSLIERHEASAPWLRRRVDGLRDGDEPPSKRIARLGRLVQLVDSRDNFMVRLFGPFVLWDLQLGLAIEDWRSRSGALLGQWLRTVGAFEAAASLARYRYERPETVFPELFDGDARFEAEDLGHPLLPADRLVRNDVRLGEAPRVWIVSGSNMSGKSTLLRTVGVATAMAQAGAPVRATSLRLSPLAIGASIRLQDSLREGTSRFYAEILRLRQIVEIAAGDTPALFLIDEFLHGTNSHDRRAGAAAIVRGLVEREAIGLITTHDLALTDIADELGEAGANVHFADELIDGRMHFDYRLREGVVRKSNAIELMRSIGLDV